METNNSKIANKINPTANKEQINKAIIAKKCTSPSELFSMATAITIIFARELNQKQLETLINLIALVLSGISAIVTQQQLCQGEDVQPPI